MSGENDTNRSHEHHETPRSKPPIPSARPPIKRYKENISLLDNLSDSSISSDTIESFSTAYVSSGNHFQTRRQLFRSTSSIKLSFNNNNENRHIRRRQAVDTSSKQRTIILISATVVLALLICLNFIHFLDDDRKKINSGWQEEKPLYELLTRSINQIQRKFSNQRIDIWDDISARLYEFITFPEKPAIIILFGNDTETLNCLAQLLGETSGLILGSNNYTTLTQEDFENSLGEVIYTLKLRVLQKGVVIIPDLLRINAERMKAFHNLCDRENPLVGKAIYIMTLTAEGCKPWRSESNESNESNSLEFVERKLRDRLSGEIEEDVLSPLITRITDGAIVAVCEEPNLKKCSLPVD